MKPISERKRTKFRGRARSHTFLALPHHLLNSEEFGALGGNATKLLIELARQFNGKNNGDLSAGWKDVQHRGWKSKATLWAAIRELVDAKFIVMTRQGGKHHLCNLYAVTWQPMNECPGKHSESAETTASNLWKKTKQQVAMCTPQVAMCTPDPEKQAA